jgi:serine/threonine protein kinase
MSNMGKNNAASGAMPETIAKYRIIRQLGRGRNSTVYLGFDPFIKRNVAVKLAAGGALTISVQTEPWYGVGRDGSVDFGSPRQNPRGASAPTHALLAEAHILGGLKHPNILGMFDAGIVGANPFIATEYIEGARSLKDFCAPHNLMPVEKALDVVRKCAEALEFAHSRGVIHGAVRPENVLLTPGFNVKLKGFSSAPPSKSDEKALDAFRYASPETARDDQATGRSDIFSLGVVLYELLTGRHPFEANNLMSLLYLIASEEPPAPGTLRPLAPDFVGEIAAMAMRKKIAERYAVCGELADALIAARKRLEEPTQEPLPKPLPQPLPKPLPEIPRKPVPEPLPEIPPIQSPKPLPETLNEPLPAPPPSANSSAIPSAIPSANSAPLPTPLPAPPPETPAEALPDRRSEMLGKLAFFDVFGARDLDELARAGQWLEYGDGIAMTGARQTDDSFCIIVAGRAAVIKAGRTIGALKEGECFAEAGGNAGLRVSARVISEGDTFVLKLTDRLLENTSPECRMRFTRTFLHTVLEKYPLIV